MTARYSRLSIDYSPRASLAIVALVAALLLTMSPASVLARELVGQTLPPVAPGGLAASPARLEMAIQPNDSELPLAVAVTNLGSQPTHVHATLDDLLVTQAGAYEAAAAGQTPYSVATVARLDREDLALDSRGAPDGTATVQISAQLDHLTRPLYGALVLELDDQTPTILDFDGLRVAPQVRPSILIPVVLVPLNQGGGADPGGPAGASHLADAIELGLRGVSLSVAAREPATPLDRLVPIAVPGVANHGPLVATTSVQNVGNAFGRAFTRYSFAAVNPIGWLPESWRGGFGLDERPFIEVEAAPAALMPDMVGETHAASTYTTGTGAELDATPWFGLVRVRATTSMVLADFTSDPVVQETYLVILPWKEGLVVGAAWGLWRFVRARRRRTTIEKVKPSVAEPAAAA